MANTSDPALGLEPAPLAWTGPSVHLVSSSSPVLSQPLSVSSPQTHLSMLALVLQWLKLVQPPAPSTGGEGQPSGFCPPCPSWSLKVPVLAPLCQRLVHPAVLVWVNPSRASLVPLLAVPWTSGSLPSPVRAHLLQSLHGVLRAWCSSAPVAGSAIPTSVPRLCSMQIALSMVGAREPLPCSHARPCTPPPPCCGPRHTWLLVAELCAHSPAS